MEEKDVLPKQRSLTEEVSEGKELPRWVKVIKRIVFWVLVSAALIGLFVLLLIAEPTEEDKSMEKAKDALAISMAMTALESAGDADLQRLTDTYGGEALTVHGQGLTLTRTRVFDSAFQGEYARRMELTYDYQGQTIRAVSIRPSSAVGLIKEGSYSLSVSSLYEMDGKRAARMDSRDTICVFADTERSAIALFVPMSLEEELANLVSQTDLYYPTASNP